MGVNADGRRELLGLKVGDSEKERGLSGLRLVVSEAHVGLTKAIRRQRQGCVWQRCRLHFARNLLQRVPRAHQGAASARAFSFFWSSRSSRRISRACC